MSLGNWGQSLLRDAVDTVKTEGGAAIQSFFGNEYLRDYQHAAKTFRTNSYEYAPKFKFLYHVYFEINPGIFNNTNKNNFGLLVKTFELPKFNFDTQIFNQYNRKRIVQSKVKYDPVAVSFHDDNSNIITGLWNQYFSYYYRDSKNPKVVFKGARGGVTQNVEISEPGLSTLTPTSEIYYDRNIYRNSITGNTSWGYIGESPSQREGVKTPFFSNITVFGFNQHDFIAYTFINPIITSYTQDTYDYAQSSGTMECRMTFDYETVVYNEGALDGKEPGNIVSGFADDSKYDRTLSPIARPGSNSTILGQGGLIDGVGGTIRAFGQGDFSGILGGVRNAGTAYNTFKNADFAAIIKSDVKGAITNFVQQTPNRNNLFDFPTFSSSPNTTRGNLPQALTEGGQPTAGQQQNGLLSNATKTLQDLRNRASRTISGIIGS